jgi:hypothetical protein
MKAIKRWLASRNGKLAEHDVVLAVSAGVTAFYATGSSYTWAGATAAGVVALKVLLRLVLPVPGVAVPVGRNSKSVGQITVEVHADLEPLRAELRAFADGKATS